jgi:hypothetical protein
VFNAQNWVSEMRNVGVVGECFLTRDFEMYLQTPKSLFKSGGVVVLVFLRENDVT